jgi:hypothetical protein
MPMSLRASRLSRSEEHREPFTATDCPLSELKSGIRPELLAELHGNISKLRCSRCEETVDRGAEQTRCRGGGPLVKSVVDFGEPLPQKDLELSYEHSRKSDVFVASQAGHDCLDGSAKPLNRPTLPVPRMREDLRCLLANQSVWSVLGWFQIRTE